MIELKDDDGFVVDLNPDKISCYGIRPEKKSGDKIDACAQFFVVCDNREFTSTFDVQGTFNRFRAKMSADPKPSVGFGPPDSNDGTIRKDIASSIHKIVMSME